MLPRLPPKQEFKKRCKNLNNDLNGDRQNLETSPSGESSFEHTASSSNTEPLQLSSPFRSPSVTVNAKDCENVMVKRFAELYSQRELADVSIICGRNHDLLKAHRYVLSCGSVYFREALEVAQCKHPIIVVKDIVGDVMGRILEYIYLGKVDLKSEVELQQFLTSAKYLQVTGIQNDRFVVTK